MILPEGTKLWIQEAPSNFHYVTYPGYAGTKRLKELAGISPEIIVLCVKDELALWCYDINDSIKLGKEIVDSQQENPNFTSELFKKWEGLVKLFYDYFKKIDDTDLKEMSDEELHEMFEYFIRVYIDEYSLPILSDIIGFFCEKELNNKLKEHLSKIGEEKNFNKYLNILSQPVKPSFNNLEKIALLKIAKQYLEGKDVSQLIKDHQKNWHWLTNNYLKATVLSEEYFFNRMKEHSKEDINQEINNFEKQFENYKKQKEALIQKLKLSEYVKLLIKLSEEYGYWQDLRKEANLHANYYLELFFEEISNRKNIPIQDLKYSTKEEILEIIRGQEINKNKIESRKICVGIIFDTKKARLCENEDALQLKKEIDSNLNISNLTDLQGIVANTGKIIGKAKIIRHPKEEEKFEQGDVLVTSMTRPEFIHIMKKASAVITDEGGITCHAAIVARELGIPCIISTKIATKVFKDNDLLEVNANHGMVRKIE